MNLLVKELIQSILEEATQTIALYPGKFKPPHAGHFDVAKQLVNKADKVVIAISPVPMDGITAEQSKSVWELYNTLLGGKLDIVIVDKSPVKYTLDTIRDNPNNKYITAFGKGEFERYKSLAGKPNVEIFDAGTFENLNARDLRAMLASGQDISKFLPKSITKDQYMDALKSHVQEEMSQADLKSIETYADKELSPVDIDFTKHFFDRLNDPRNIKPISPAELIGFFKRLARKKDKLDDFLKQYREIVASDNRTDINIPLVQMSDKIIAKTIMRKKNFQTSDPKIELQENCGCIHTQQPTDFKSALASLTKYMLDQGLDIKPLPKLKIVNNDSKNAENILGRTAYYDPTNCSITLYTLNRHPKDVLRSYSHEMIHRIQDNQGRLNNVNTTNTNEDSDLQELEKEAYLNGNMIFRNWEDSIKNPINEWIIDIPKYNYNPKLSNKIFSQLHELKANEIILNPNNAVKINGNSFDGEFKVGSIEYIYSIKSMPNPYNDNGLFYNIQFDEKHNNMLSNEPTGNAKENYIKILSTMYKIILNIAEKEQPKYIGISSLDKSGYRNIYNNLIKTNKLPGYSKKDAGLDFTSRSGEKGKFIVLKKIDV